MLALTFWSLALVVCAVGIVVSLNSWRFARGVAGDARGLWAGSPPAVALERRAGEDLPSPVRRYLDQCGAFARRPLRAARVRHGGTLTLQPGARPLPVRGEQYFNADPPGFVWWGRVRLAPGVWIDARDKAVAGQAGMRVMFESSRTIQDVAGPELDQGALVRLLGELAWLPTAFLDRRYVSWAPIDAGSARATLRVRGREVSAVFHFGADGMPVKFTAERFRDLGDGRAALTPFVGVLRDWRVVEGLRVPFAVQASWLLDPQPYTFAHFTIEDVEFDRPEIF